MPVAGASRAGGYYRFTLPAGAPTANAPFDYDGIRFAQVMWPLSGSADRRAVTLMHESFHRIPPKLGFVVKGSRSGATTISGDPVPDTESGRIWLRGEIHALRAALTSSAGARRRALTDALELRAYRHAILPSTVGPELHGKGWALTLSPGAKLIADPSKPGSYAVRFRRARPERATH